MKAVIGPSHVSASGVQRIRRSVAFGRSVTFGYGVDDAETWVNLVAREFPDWHVINEAYPGWSIKNLEGAWEMHPDADMIFVLTITNDSDEPERRSLHAHVSDFGDLVSPEKHDVATHSIEPLTAADLSSTSRIFAARSALRASSSSAGVIVSRIR